MQFPEIKTKRCLLRQVVSEDKPDILRGLSNPAVTEFMPIHYTSIEDVDNQMEFYDNHWQFQTGIFWAIEWVETNALTGVIGLYDINTFHNSAEWGFWLLPEWRGKGIIGEAGPLVLDYGFKTLNLNRIKGEVETHNTASIEIMRKFKFTHEGTLRQCEMNRHGQYIDLMIFSRLRSDVS